MTKGQSSTYKWLLLGLLILCFGSACAVEQSKIFVKDGVQYGHLRGIWRGRWWNYYERGISYAAGGFWEAAAADFRTAMKQRNRDQRQARTYGMHFIDYFPHRELGVAYQHLGRQPEAIEELETSLRMSETAKAKFYLNKAHLALLEQTQGDKAPPQIVIDAPTDQHLTKQFTITINGHVDDDTFVSAITINREPFFIELAKPHQPFTHEVTLSDGANTIEVVAADLMGRVTRQSVTVRLDRRGPIVSADAVERPEAPDQPRVHVRGQVSDQSPLVRFQLAGESIAVPAATDWTFDHVVSRDRNTTSLPFEVEDEAGNMTRGEIALAAPIARPGTRTGHNTEPLWPRWASLNLGGVMSDAEPRPTPPWQVAQHSGPPPPVIKLANLSDRQTVYLDSMYLEGQVRGASAITGFTINNVPLWNRKSRQLFFGYIASLKPGDNTFQLEAVDEAGHRIDYEVIIRHEVQSVKRHDARLRLILLPLDRKGEVSPILDTVYDALFNALVNQGRFALVERQQIEAILQELKLSQSDLVDPATAAKIGKIASADAILMGSVTSTQLTNGQGTAIEVDTRLIDVETAVALSAADVYGEDLNLRNLRTLLKGLALKFQRNLPVAEGLVLKVDGNQALIDLGGNKSIKPHMKVMLFRQGEVIKHPITGKVLGAPSEELGESRIKSVFDEFSQVTLPSDLAAKVKQLDQVMTK